ncbi:hypothetical protein ACFQZ4_53485 [Catellatospora coxensis]
MVDEGMRKAANAPMLKHDLAQAERDSKISEAVARLLESLAEVPNACVMIGTLLVVKTDQDGGPIVLARTLSMGEQSLFTQHPDMFKDPHKVWDSLALARDVTRSSNVKAGSATDT